MMLGRQLLSNIPCAEWFQETNLVIGQAVVDATRVNSGVMTLWTFNGNIQDGWTTVEAQTAIEALERGSRRSMGPSVRRDGKQWRVLDFDWSVVEKSLKKRLLASYCRYLCSR